MLSGETANGDFPENAVSIMRRICEEAEEFIDYSALYQAQVDLAHGAGDISSVEAVCSSAVKASIDAKAPLIIALTETGHTARLLASYRPKAPILAISASETSIRQLLCVRGVVPMVTASFQGTDSVISKALVKAKEDGMVKAGDICVAIHGTREECPGHLVANCVFAF